MGGGGGGVKPPKPHWYLHPCTASHYKQFHSVTASEYCLPLLCLQGAGTLGLHCSLNCPSEATGIQILYPSLPLCEVSISLWPHSGALRTDCASNCAIILGSLCAVFPLLLEIVTV